jgi:retron-type reverse transcriptase
VLDLDIKSFFDETDWDLLMRAVRRNTDCPWVLLYLERLLRTSVSMPNGDLVDQESGTPARGCCDALNAKGNFRFDRELRQVPAEWVFEDEG